MRLFADCPGRDYFPDNGSYEDREHYCRQCEDRRQVDHSFIDFLPFGAAMMDSDWHSKSGQDSSRCRAQRHYDEQCPQAELEAAAR
jgi:hypothetical protein